MAIENYIFPTIHPSAFIAASADVIGRVTIHEEKRPPVPPVKFHGR